MYNADYNLVEFWSWWETGCTAEHRYIDTLDGVKAIARDEAKRFNQESQQRITSLQDLADTPPAYCAQLAHRIAMQYGIDVTGADVQAFRTLEYLGREVYEEMEEARCRKLFPV